MSTLDIVIPVFNEGPALLEVLRLMEQQIKTPFQVLICYDFEGDSTLVVLKDFKPGFPLHLVRNKGRGAHNAVVTGFEASQADCVIVVPADDPHNVHILDGMVKKFEQGCDIVVASRFMKGGLMSGCPWLKSILVRTASFTLNAFAFIPVKDSSNGFRLFSRKILEQVKIESTTGFTYSLELLVKCHRLGWKIGEVPAVWYERTEGQSHFKVIGWLPVYLKWYFYGFATSWLGRKANSVARRKGSYFSQ